MSDMHDVLMRAEQPTTAQYMDEEATQKRPFLNSQDAADKALTARDLRLSPHLAGAISMAFRDTLHERNSRLWRTAFFLLLLCGFVPLLGAHLQVSLRDNIQLYVLEKDKLGHVVARGAATPTALDDPLVTVSQLGDWITAARSVVRDRHAQDQHTKKLWSMVADESLAARKVAAWYTKDRLFGNPRRSIDVTDVHVAQIPESERSWKLEWREALYEDARSLPVRTRHSAHLTVLRKPQPGQRREEDVLLNPANLFVTDIVVKNL